MRKLLLASAAILGATGGLALAQTAPNPMSGKMVAPLSGGPASNNNNNAWGIANTPTGSAAAGGNSFIYAPNAVAVPDPGTVVIRLNGRVHVELGAHFTSVDKGVGANAGFKLNPVNLSSYMRLYPGFDGRATNGLRYGASVELRENFGVPTAPAASPSAYSFTQTVYVRRAFTYLASDQAGIVRFGQTDGVIGLFDNCVFTSGCWDGGVGSFNGGGMQGSAPSGATGIPFVWLAQAGTEYSNNKIVYLSPQFFGFDFGAQYAPNMGNSYANPGSCVQASSTCTSVSSGNDPTRWLNQVGVGLRFQQTFGAVDVKAYGFYETAGKENLTTAAYTVPSKAGLTSTFRYDNLSFYKAGVAITAMNTTFAADYIGGAVNGQLAMRPTGGVDTNAVVTGVTYRNGPITLGAEFGVVETQGDARLTGVSQRHEYEIAFGGAYNVAPGLTLVGEYMYTSRHQGGFDFANGALGAGGLTRDSKAQGVLFATVLTW